LDEFIFKRFLKTGHKLFFQLLFATITVLPWTGVVSDLPLFSIEDKIVDPETGGGIAAPGDWKTPGPQEEKSAQY